MKGKRTTVDLDSEINTSQLWILEWMWWKAKVEFNVSVAENEKEALADKRRQWNLAL